jgi:hypothetical protein
MSGDLPEPQKRPSLLEWIEGYLPFNIPRIPLPQTARNLDKAFAQLVMAGGENLTARLASDTAKVKALGNARTGFIEHGARLLLDGNSDFDERALGYVLENARLGQSSRERILELTAEEIHNHPPQQDAKSEIETDWLRAFAKYASEKSSDEIRALWAKILAGEIRAPKSTSLRTLARVSTFDREDAEVAHSILNYAISESFILQRAIVDHPGKVGLPSHDLILKAVDVGVISGIVSGYYFDLPEDNELLLHKKLINISSPQIMTAQLDVYPLTSLGVELLKLSGDFAVSNDYLNFAVKELKRTIPDAEITITDLDK